MKIKTNELTGAALDWAVAKCEGGHIGVANNGVFFDAHDGDGFTSFEPSTDWAQGGPIIDREHISTAYVYWGEWEAWDDKTMPPPKYRGPSPLIAAMRCYVASKLGDEVDVPEELCPPTA
jgi:hypothetical protein